MERKIGEIFTCDDKTYQVVKGIICDGCCILHDHCFSIRESLGPCADANRTDKTGIVFKEINNMEIKNNQLTIDIPKGMEIDLENSDLVKGIIKFRDKWLTLERIHGSAKEDCYLTISRESVYVFDIELWEKITSEQFKNAYCALMKDIQDPDFGEKTESNWLTVYKSIMNSINS